MKSPMTLSINRPGYSALLYFVLQQFTGKKYDMAVKWLTKKVKSLFLLKDCNLHPSCKIYKGICRYKETYIGQTIRNVDKRWSEHNFADNKSEPAKNLADNEEHFFL